MHVGSRTERTGYQTEGVKGKDCPGWKTRKSQSVGKDLSISQNRKNSSMSHMRSKGVLLVTGSKTFSTRDIKKSLAETG